jgi:aryl-alcohol dehydrogenase-like predicted oxidoreductase
MKQIKRRQFITQSAAAASTLLLGASLRAVADAQPAKFDPYETVPLGKTKLKMSRVCLGTGMRGGNRQSNHTRMGKEKFEALIKGAYDRGVRVFDLADMYGTHPFLGPALAGIPRDRYQIITKIWWRPGGIPEAERPDADVCIERFLKELKTDYLDLLLLHCVEKATWPQDLRKQMDIIAKFKEKGVVRAHGVSCHSLPALEAAVTEPWVDSVHARINPYGDSMDGPAEKVAPVLKKLCDAGKGVVGMKIIGEGRYRTDEEKKNASINYALNLGCVHVLNVGCETLDEVDDLATRIKQVEKKTA